MGKRKIDFTLEGFIILILIIIILSLIFIPSLRNVKNSYSSKVDLFGGKITNIKMTPQNLSGVGVYDKTCKKVGEGLTRCDAGIKTKKYGVLNFNYVHDMKIEPCITSGDKLNVEILNSNGTAKVWRIKQ